MKFEEEYSGFFANLIKYVKNIFDKTKKQSGSKLDQILIASAKSAEEAETIKEMCNNVDLYYAKREEYRTSGLEPGKWLEGQIEQTVKEVYPQVDVDDIDAIKIEVAKAMEAEIEVYTKLVDDEISPVSDVFTQQNNSTLSQS